jgi:hypothetical protein
MNAPTIACLGALSLLAAPANAQTPFTRWDFNAAGLSVANPAAVLANNNSAEALLIGGTTPGASGAFLADSGSSDAGTGWAWSISNFPLQGTGSGTAGAEFRADATGFSNITFELDLKTTGTFSDFVAVQYSLDHGATWTAFNAAPFQLPGNTNPTATVWTNNLGGGVGGLPSFALPASANDWSDLRVRLVTVFDPALGSVYSPNSPVNNAGSPQGYQPQGSIRFDMVEFRGAVSQGTSPSIAMEASSLSPGSICAGATTPVLIRVAVTPGAGPASTSISATADASSIGGPPALTMTPAGMDLAGRWVFERVAVAASSSGQRPVHVVVVDNHARTANATLWLTVAACCPADLDNDGIHSNGAVRDGGVDINDLLFFLTGFELGAGDVDLDNDGDPAVGTPDGGVDINDLLFFLARFEGGC